MSVDPADAPLLTHLSQLMDEDARPAPADAPRSADRALLATLGAHLRRRLAGVQMDARERAILARFDAQARR